MDAIGQLNDALAGRYTLERELGRGGMATVYLAADARHHRRVAFKVLSPELGAVLGVERFLAEIRVTANLQHPNLLPLFDSGEAEGLLFYVMPYVEGESLRARIEREKQLPIDEALHIAASVASALDYAHRHGVIHRDLKPENILLHEGQPLVADFGIALAVSNAGGNRITQTGLSLGTPHYMSPEQATGDRALDGRTDIYSLGAVLYEMLTGEPPHSGTTAQSIIAKVLTDRPRSIRLTRESVPAHVEAAVDRALSKLPADRFATPQQFADALSGKVVLTSAAATATAADTGAPNGTVARGFARGRALLPWAFGVLGVGIAVWALVRTPRAEPMVTARFTLTYAANEQVMDPGGVPFAFSPDGSLIVYRAGDGGRNRLYVRPVDQLEARSLPGTENALSPCFSPDGKWIAFAQGGRVSKIPASGGAVVPLADFTVAASGLTWSTSGVLLGPSLGGLVAIPEVGGAARLILKADSTLGESTFNPFALPDGRHVALGRYGRTGPATAHIIIVSLADGKAIDLGLVGTTVLGVLDGQLLYATASGALMAVKLDMRRLATSGAPVPVVDGVRMGPGGTAKAAVSSSGSLVYLSGSTAVQLALTAPGGVAQPLKVEPRSYDFPRYSPDGQRIAVSVAVPTRDIWIYDLGSETLRRLTAEGINDRQEWSPDGRRVLFRSERGNGSELWWQLADGSSPAERLLGGTGQDLREGVLSPDGRILLYRVDDPKTAEDLWYVRRDGDKKPQPFLVTPFSELAARFSPDGRWVAYQSSESGVFQVYVRPFPGPGSVYQVSTDGGGEPLWSRDGRRVFYRNGRQFTEASVTTSPSFAVTARRVAHEGDYPVFGTPVHATYDVAPDGNRFLVRRSLEGADRTIVVHDWKYELRRRLTSGR